ncbi:MAG: hypothetical protein V4642_11695 [Bacteroidota bacterium]
MPRKTVLPDSQGIKSEIVFKNRENSPRNIIGTVNDLFIANPHNVVCLKNLMIFSQLIEN